MEPYYNITSDGQGFEGILHYVGDLTNGWFSLTFLSAIFIIMVYVMSKSEWKMPGIIAFASFTTMILAWIMKLFMTVNDSFIFGLAILLAGSVTWSILSENSR